MVHGTGAWCRLGRGCEGRREQRATKGVGEGEREEKKEGGIVSVVLVSQ